MPKTVPPTRMTAPSARQTVPLVRWSASGGVGGIPVIGCIGCIRPVSPTSSPLRCLGFEPARGGAPASRGGGAEPLERQPETVLRLHHREPDVVRGGVAVELAGADEQPRLCGEPPGDRPGIAIGARDPEV